MQLFGINTAEFLILIVLAMVLIGPDKLPEYIAKLRDWIRQARGMAEGAKSQLEEQMGPEFRDIDWKQYDPRQYDPRAIVRQALFDEPRDEDADADLDPGTEPPPTPEEPVTASSVTRYDPDRATPWDDEAT